MIHRRFLAALSLVWLPACGSDTAPRAALAAPTRAQAVPTSATPTCRVADPGRPLPEEVRETSGLVRSRRDPGLFWTHNDSGYSADLFGLDITGQIVSRVRVTGADVTDWEDLEAGPCAAGTCLFVGDIGDNDQARSGVTIYEIDEPGHGSSATEPARALHARFPEGPQDAEALFALPSGDLFLVTKGRHGPISLYRYPRPRRTQETATLQHVRQLFSQPEDEKDRVTAATASPDGRWVGIRTYRTLFLFRSSELVGAAPVSATPIDLMPLNELQGEALAIADDGTIWLTSEAENNKDQPRWSRLQCTLPADGPA